MEKTLSEKMQEIKRVQETSKNALEASANMFDAIEALLSNKQVTQTTRSEIKNTMHDFALLINVAVSEAFGFNDIAE